MVPATILALVAALAPVRAVQAATTEHRARAPIESASIPSTGRARPATPLPNGHIPCDLWNAYHATPTAGKDDGAGQTIAIVDPYDTSTIAADFTAFSNAFNLGGPALAKVQPSGPPDLTQSDVSLWQQEIPLGVEWAHALAPAAQIVLVEARTSLDTDMVAAIDYAVSTVKADVVSMSWTFDESAYTQTSVLAFDAHFPTLNGANRPVSYFAATGDVGPTPAWPAVSPRVVAVGGTSVQTSAFGGLGTASHTDCSTAVAPLGVTQTNETAWSGTGGGVSAFELKPGYQTAAPGNARATPDVAMLADPNNGVAVYAGGTWTGSVLGGTSLSTPMWAALTARLNQQRSRNQSGVGWLYFGYTPTLHTGFNDVITGTSSTGGTPPVTASAGPGYDMVTGLGTPLWNALAASAPPPFTYYFPWFDRLSPGMANDNIHVVNPNDIDVTVIVTIPGQPGCTSGKQVIHPGAYFIYSCATGFGGPVTVSADQPVVASQRVQYNGSFNEVRANSRADTALYFPWYDHASTGMVNDNIHVVNPSAGQVAHVTISLPGAANHLMTLQPGTEDYWAWPVGTIGGPVTLSSDVPVLASQRVQYFQTFNETLGKRPTSDASKSLVFNWYDWASPGMAIDNVHLVNPSGTDATATVAVGTAKVTATVPMHGTAYVNLPSVIGGPVTVSANVPVIASQRVQFNNSFNEVAGTPADGGANSEWMTWYDSASPGMVVDNIHVLNADPSRTAHVTIVGPGGTIGPFDVGPGTQSYRNWSQIIGGPVHVTSSGANIIASQRVEFYQTFNEAAALTG